MHKTQCHKLPAPQWHWRMNSAEEAEDEVSRIRILACLPPSTEISPGGTTTPGLYYPASKQCFCTALDLLGSSTCRLHSTLPSETTFVSMSYSQSNFKGRQISHSPCLLRSRASFFLQLFLTWCFLIPLWSVLTRKATSKKRFTHISAHSGTMKFFTSCGWEHWSQKIKSFV